MVQRRDPRPSRPFKEDRLPTDPRRAARQWRSQGLFPSACLQVFLCPSGSRSAAVAVCLKLTLFVNPYPSLIPSLSLSLIFSRSPVPFLSLSSLSSPSSPPSTSSPPSLSSSPSPSPSHPPLPFSLSDYSPHLTLK